MVILRRNDGPVDEGESKIISEIILVSYHSNVDNQMIKD